jgi:hypothetical protein
MPPRMTRSYSSFGVAALGMQLPMSREETV